jgi:hypothetical protein
MRLLRELCVQYPYSRDFRGGLFPLQLGLNGSPWHVATASVLICRTRRESAEPVIWAMFDRWSDYAAMAAADSEQLEDLIRPLGLYRNRARALIRLSQRWDTDTWDVIDDLPGVGAYVSDAVRILSFGNLPISVNDKALAKFADLVGTGDVRIECAFCSHVMRSKHASTVSKGVCNRCFESRSDKVLGCADVDAEVRN